MDSTTEIFEGSIPTEPDIRLLRKAFPDSAMVDGFSIPYEDVARIINVDVDSSRFKTVTTKWRNQVEKDIGKVVDAPRNGAFHVAMPSRIISMARQKSKSASRFIKRSAILTKRVDRSQLTEDEAKQLDFTQRANGVVLAAMQTASKIALPSLADATQKANDNETV